MKARLVGPGGQPLEPLVGRSGRPVSLRLTATTLARRFLKGLDPSVWEPALGIPVARVQTLVPPLNW